MTVFWGGMGAVLGKAAPLAIRVITADTNCSTGIAAKGEKGGVCSPHGLDNGVMHQNDHVPVARGDLKRTRTYKNQSVLATSDHLCVKLSLRLRYT